VLSIKKSLTEVKFAASSRTSEQEAAINFWGGVPGTEAPAGIWQNRMYDVTQGVHFSNTQYAYAQMVLAQSVADSFMECWKIKYKYWTKRPNMVDSTIDVAMDNPHFPSYVSGHSTISWTAAEVLTAMFPSYENIWFGDAKEAQNSRLWAGIHFSHDNEEGADLGRKIGNLVVLKLHPTAFSE
jgi:hypothetical protein